MDADDLLAELEGELRVSAYANLELDNALTDIIDRPSHLPRSLAPPTLTTLDEDLDDYINRLLDDEDGGGNGLPDDAEEYSQSTLLHLVDGLVDDSGMHADHLTRSDEERVRVHRFSLFPTVFVHS